VKLSTSLCLLSVVLPTFLGCHGGSSAQFDTGGSDSTGQQDTQNHDSTIDSNDTADTRETGAETGDTDTAPPPPIDGDGDGYTTETDCDDADDGVHPGADEVNDGIDDDCDGLVDEIDVCAGEFGDYESIQSAIEAVDDGVVIAICPGTFHENLSIHGKLVTLVGTGGAKATVVDGGDRGSVLTVRATPEGAAIVQGLTLQNGTSRTTGGGVLCETAQLELVDDVIRSNTAPSGAGFSASDCDSVLTGNSFEENVATASDGVGAGGGALISDSTVTLSGNQFTSNRAYEGGGLFVEDATGVVVIDGNSFRSNLAIDVDDLTTPLGGGLFVSGNSPVTNNVFDSNESDYNGGGAYFYLSASEVRNNTVTGNDAGLDGGGFYVNQGTGDIAQNVFESNSATDDAGGLRVYYSTLTVEDNTFTDNTAEDDGGGLKLSHAVNTVTGNTFDGNSAGDAGGGIELDNETSQISDCVFMNNTAFRGAGLHAWRTGGTTEVIETSEFYDNAGVDCGGALSFDNLTYNITLRDLDIHDNTSGDGAALCLDLVWWDSDGDGDVDTWEPSHATLENLLIYDNVASDNAAVYIKASTVHIANVTLDANTGAVGSAFAFKLEEETPATVSLTNSIVSNHTSDEALYNVNSTVTVTYSDFYGNVANTYGMDDPVGTSYNIGEDPLYSDAAAHDYHLESTSPCINAGNPGRSYTDADGSRADMGAYGGPLGGW
jgi:hypothetical protein